jgi:ABC-2 type transport system ATP-binding protein
MTADRAQAPAIHVRGLEKSYERLRAQRGVDFDVARGSIFALLGSNGAGSSPSSSGSARGRDCRRGSRSPAS